MLLHEHPIHTPVSLGVGVDRPGSRRSWAGNGELNRVAEIPDFRN